VTADRLAEQLAPVVDVYVASHAVQLGLMLTSIVVPLAEVYAAGDLINI